jgi:tRNA (guanine37-N1)-methyltransferase
VLQIGVVTLFPEMFSLVARFGITGRAIAKGLVSLQTWNPRDYARDRHRTVDDRPYGGGPGMVMMVEPLRDAIRDADKGLGGNSYKIALTPQGRRLDQAGVAELAARGRLVLVCGRYEGMDERLIETEIDEEWSIGDYVLSGGEIPAMVLIDAMIRLLPGSLGHEDSAREDSFFDGLLDYPHYTRPEDVEGRRVPEVLLSGNHGEIRRWRLKQALGRTWLRRPELLKQRLLDAEQKALLDEFIREHAAQAGDWDKVH